MAGFYFAGQKTVGCGAKILFIIALMIAGSQLKGN
jgi:hypothetical protein